MIDGLSEDTGDASLHEAGAAIASLFSKIEDTQGREAPPRKPTPVKPVVAEAPSEEEVQTEQPSSDDEPVVVDEEPEPTSPAPRKLRVKVDGEELELPEDEVVKGYSRQADYTRKTQKHAEEVRTFEGERTAVREERQRNQQLLTQLEEVLKSATPTEPDWDTLRDGDPAVFAATYAAWDQHQKQIEKVSAARADADRKVQADRDNQLKDHLKAEGAKLIEAIPTWKDPKVAKAEMAELTEYARTQGYTDEDLSGITDHRVFKILRDAHSFQKAQAEKPAIEAKIERAKELVPGPNTPSREVSELTRRKQALAKTHSLRDAGNAIALLLDGE